MIGVAIALIVVSFAAMFAMVYSQSGTVRRIEETQLRQIGADTTAQKMIDQRIDNIITVHNSTVEHYDKEIEEIVQKMEKITEDIARIDHDEKDLRRYYVNYKQPVVSDHGVEWAKDFPDQEDHTDAND